MRVLGDLLKCNNSVILTSINGKSCYSSLSSSYGTKKTNLRLTTRRKYLKRSQNISFLNKELNHISQVLQNKNLNNKKEKESIKVSATSNAKIENSEEKQMEPRKNDFNIQMLSDGLYHQIFGNNVNQNKPDPDIVKKAQQKLKEHGLWKEDVKFLKDVSLQLPPLKGTNIEEHFWAIGSEQADPYKTIVSNFVKNGIPNAPENWLCQKGWTKYVPGKKPQPVACPEEDVIVFDVEICMKLGGAPTLATAVSEKAWYGWVCSDLPEELEPIPKTFYNSDMFIPLENDTIDKNLPRIAVGFNVSFDRARVKEQYNLNHSALRFLDILSMHICIGGLQRNQKALIQKNYEKIYDPWKAFGCLSNLKETYMLYCHKEISKESRNFFVEGKLSDIRQNFQSLMNYCSKDTLATFEILQVLFPLFLKRFPHPVTFAGMLEMGSVFLTVNTHWNKFIADVDQTYEDLKNEVTSVLSRKSDNACKLLHNEAYKNDLWMWNEDWSVKSLKLTKKKLKNKDSYEPQDLSNISEEQRDEEEEKLNKKFKHLFDMEQILPLKKPFLPGYPLWYRKLCPKVDSQDWTPHAQLSTTLQITPKLLNLSWEKFPLFHTAEYGWGILVADIFKDSVNADMPFQLIKDLTIKNCNLNPNNISCFAPKKNKQSIKYTENPIPYYKGSALWCNHKVNDCCYFYKLPHKNGHLKNVGNPLSKDFAQIFSTGLLSDLDSTAGKVIDIWNKIMYWRNNRERILGQMVVWLKKKEFQNFYGDEESAVGIIIPKIVVCGTLTRRAMEGTWLTVSKVNKNRIGSELRSIIQAPPGYHFVGADVDCQELWISSLIGDSHFAKQHGSTPLGWMALSGSKTNGTDLHSMTAKTIGISREHAKVLNYARIYGAGVKFASTLLQQFNPTMSPEEAYKKATIMYSFTKGNKVFKVKDEFAFEFQKLFGYKRIIYNLSDALKVSKFYKKKLGDVFENPYWEGGTESAMFNQLESIADSWAPVTPFLEGRISRALEPKFKGDDFHKTTRINWIVQSGAVDFLHLMLVCMKWLTNGHARLCFSFHDEVRFLVLSEHRYNAALALNITNLLVRAFCSHRLGIYDLPQSVAFFSSVEVDKTLRKEADDDCVTPSNPHGIEKGYGTPPGESLNIYEVIEKSGGSLSPFEVENSRYNLIS